MITRLKNQTIWVIFLIVLPLMVRSQDFPSGDDIDPPPPAAPIDDSIVVLWVAAVLLAVYFFYKKNIKIENK